MRWLPAHGAGRLPELRIMTFAEVIASTGWAEVAAAIRACWPEEDLEGYRRVFAELRAMGPEPDPMRIAIECRPLLGEDAVVPEVIGRNGTLNRDLDDFRHMASHADPTLGDREVAYSLSLHPWRCWLGMTVEPETLRAYSPAEVVAHCLWDMTFHGFSEAAIREVSDELDRRSAAIDAMTPEERAEKLIPAEEVFASLRQKDGVDE